jgi:lincosamide nucleotidyltransferase A/C/D/E
MSLEPIMPASHVVNLYKELAQRGITIWVDGGWSVDALLERQLRPHKDLDIAIEWKDVPRLRAFLSEQGYKQVREDSQWNFVLSNADGHEIDVHGFIYDDKKNIVDGVLYPTGSLTGAGTIDGTTVRCIAPKYQVEFLAPWIHKWPEKYVRAVAALCEHFDIELPREYKEYVKSL